MDGGESFRAVAIVDDAHSLDVVMQLDDEGARQGDDAIFVAFASTHIDGGVIGVEVKIFDAETE